MFTLMLIIYCQSCVKSSVFSVLHVAIKGDKPQLSNSRSTMLVKPEHNVYMEVNDVQSVSASSNRRKQGVGRVMFRSLRAHTLPFC